MLLCPWDFQARVHINKYDSCLDHFGMSMHYFSLNSMDLVQTWIVIGTFSDRNSTIKPKKANPESKADVMKPTWCHKHNTRVALHHKPQRGPWRQPRLPKRQQQLLRSSSTNTKSCQSPEFSVSLNLKVKSLSRVWLFATPWTDCSPPGSSVHGILQARILEWVAISFSRGFSWPRDQTRVSCSAGRHFTVWATREALSLDDAKNETKTVPYRTMLYKWSSNT